MPKKIFTKIDRNSSPYRIYSSKNNQMHSILRFIIGPEMPKETKIHLCREFIGPRIPIRRWQGFMATQRNISEILLNQTEIRLHLPFPN